MSCNGYEGGSSEAGDPSPPSCARCKGAIVGTVYVALVLEAKWDDWQEEWGEWEDLWWPNEVCEACFGDQPVRYTVECARCGRTIKASAHVAGAPRTYCSGRCRWAAEDERAGRRREGRPKVCGWCGTTFIARRSDAVYCSGRHRVAAHRAGALGRSPASASENTPGNRYSMSEEK